MNDDFYSHTANIWQVHVYAINALFKAHIAHLRQQCHNSKFVIYQEKRWKVLKCYNFLWVQRRHNCSPAASFANCVMTLRVYLLKVHLRTFLSIPVTQKCQILSCDTLVANERYVNQSCHASKLTALNLSYEKQSVSFKLCPLHQAGRVSSNSKVTERILSPQSNRTEVT